MNGFIHGLMNGTRGQVRLRFPRTDSFFGNAAYNAWPGLFSFLVGSFKILMNGTYVQVRLRFLALPLVRFCRVALKDFFTFANLAKDF